MPKKLLSWMTIIFFALASNSIIASSVSDKLSGKINTIISQSALPATMGIIVQSMNTGRLLYVKNSNNLFVPASNLKLFTAVAALLYLGPDYQYQTTLLTDAANSNNGILTGNIYLKFSGDPDLTTEQLNNLLIAAFKKNNISTIQGNIYIDNSVYNDKQYAPGWMWDELNLCYAAPITPIMLNHNCFSMTLTPAAQVNEKAQLSTENFDNLTPVINQVQMTNVDSDNCSLQLKSLGKNNYLLSGCMSTQDHPINLQIAIRDPYLYAKDLVATLLRMNGITLQGNIVNGVVPENARILASQSSQPISVLVKEMLKNSDNQIANSLFMTLSEKYYHQSATWNNASKAMQAILLQNAGINFSNASIVDGAGISRYNMVTPQQLAQLLYFSYRNATIFPALMASLPIAGEDGTLKDRMQAENVRGQLRAKTGSMTGISALSGYVITHDGKTVSFVILVNNFLGNTENRVHQLEDQIGQYLTYVR